MRFPFRKQSDPTHDRTIETEHGDIVASAENKSFSKSILPVFACGAGLFSDGYVNNVIGSVSTILSLQFGSVYSDSTAINNVASIAFAGTVVGQLFFGFLADRWSRVNTLLVSTTILIIFTALCAGSYWHGNTTSGTLSMLVAWRFFVGIGIGGEYPAGSVGCAENTGELKSGSRNRWFIMFTNTAIDWGFVVGAFVPYVVAAACDNGHYSTQWRTSLGIGVVFPLILFVLRLRIKEPEEFSKNSMAHTRTPWWLVIKFYGFRLFVVSLIWFIYDFLTYPFSIYSSSIVKSIYGSDAALTTVFGWSTVINLFYIPGTILGAFLSDYIGPRYCLALGVSLQSIVGFIMAACYPSLSRPDMVGAFAVVYGIFLSLGELGPGNNIGLLASKTSATGIRGTYYGIAAALGKVGAFIGTYIFKYIEAAGGSENASAQYPFYVSSSLGILSAALALFLLPNVGQDTIQKEDLRFREYLESQGWDTSQLGLRKGGQQQQQEEEGGVEVVGSNDFAAGAGETKA